MSERHGPRSPRWRGHPRKHQEQARAIYELEMQRALHPWAWIITDCDVPLCLDVECMTALEPIKVLYPAGICTYCGEPAVGRDHLIPRPMSGAAQRRSVLTVTACKDCNQRINDFPSPSVTERRERAQASIRRTNAATLKAPTKTLAELRQMGPTLRSAAVKHNRKREWLLARLAWPDDPFYDLRAFQRTGIDDPVALGLIAEVDYRRTA